MIYLGTLGLFLICSLFILQKGQRSLAGKKKTVCGIWFFLFGFLAMLRGVVGTDIKTYYGGFEEIAFGLPRITSRTWEPGYVLLNKVTALLSNGFYQMLLSVVAIVAFGLMLLFVYNHSQNAVLSLYLFVTLFHYFAWLNMMRQSLAIAITLLAYTFAIKRNFPFFCLCIIIACTFHITAICALPIYFFVNTKLTNYLIVFLTGISLLLFCFIDKIFLMLTKLVPKYDFYAKLQDVIGGRSLINLVIPICVFVAGACIYGHLPNNLRAHGIRLVNLSFFSLLISILQLRIGVLERLNYYYGIYYILLIPVIVSSLANKMQKTVAILIVLFGGVTYTLYIFSRAFHNVLPYNFFWEGVPWIS